MAQEDLATGEPANDMTWHKKKNSFAMTAFVSTSRARTDFVLKQIRLAMYFVFGITDANFGVVVFVARGAMFMTRRLNAFSCLWQIALRFQAFVQSILYLARGQLVDLSCISWQQISLAFL